MLARDVRIAYDTYFEPLGLNLSQASLIGYVASNGPMTQTQLAAALVLGRAATGTMIDQLEARGLVQRVPDPSDRRVWIVENTADGAELAVDIVKVDEELRSHLRKGITQAERRQLADVLLRMAANAESALECASPVTPNKVSSKRQNPN